MNRNLKALGLALFAALALGALGAGAAAADVFVAEPSSTVLTASDDPTESEAHSFSYGIGTAECKVTNFAGEAPTTEETEIAITPTYDECEFLEEPAVVRTNHCAYIFTSHTGGGGDAPVHIDCDSAGEHIEIEVPSFGGCTVTVGEQETSGGVAFTNEGTGSEADVTVDITAEVVATRDNPTNNFFCSLLPAGEKGAYTGNSTLKGYEYASGPSTQWTEEEAHITDEVGTTHWSWGEGDQVGISVDDTT